MAMKRRKTTTTTTTVVAKHRRLVDVVPVLLACLQFKSALGKTECLGKMVSCLISLCRLSYIMYNHVRIWSREYIESRRDSDRASAVETAEDVDSTHSALFCVGV